MHFAHPYILLLLILPVILAVWELRRRGYRVAMPFDHGAVTQRPVLKGFVNAAGMLPALIAATGIIILAGPQKETLGESVREERNIHFLVDVSGSMNGIYGKDTRYAEAMKAISRFTTYRDKQDSFALSAFGTEVIHWLPLTRDLSAIRLAAPFLDPSRLPPYMSGTMIGKALMETLPLMEKIEGDRMIILMTDGQSGDLGGDRARVVAQALRTAHIRVTGIFIGNNESTEDLQTITTLTDGLFFSAGDPDALEETFKQIDAMHKTKVNPPGIVYADNFGIAGIAALSLAGLMALMAFGLRYTPW